MIFNSRVRLHFLQDFDVPRERVFNFFSEHERLAHIYPGAFKRIVNSSDPRNVNGLGSVRQIVNLPLVFEETITAFQEPEYIEYKVTGGLVPIKNHVGKMRFITLEGGRSRLDYTIEFDPIYDVPMMGFIIKNLNEKLVGNAIRDLSFKFKENPRF